MSIELRAETAEDEPFLRTLFAAIRASEFAMLPPPQRDMITAMQFNLQRNQYRASYIDADWWVVERDGMPMGRLYVARIEGSWNIVDIALLPEVSGQGIGGELLDRLIAEATAAGMPVSLMVRPENPARRLYLRKGFLETGMAGVDIAMLRPIS